MMVLLAAALLGGALTVAVLWPYGALLALAGASFGESFMALLAGLVLALLRTRTERERERRADALRDGPKAAA